jgi:hypothetical protein
MGRASTGDLPDGESEIFLQKGAGQDLLICPSGNQRRAIARRYFAAIRNDRPASRLAVIDPENAIMRDDFQPPPFVYEGLDPVRPSKSVIAQATEVVKSVVACVGDAIDQGRKPGMPLSVLSNVTREAPLAALLVAFVLGVAVARRR